CLSPESTCMSASHQKSHRADLAKHAQQPSLQPARSPDAANVERVPTADSTNRVPARMCAAMPLDGPESAADRTWLPPISRRIVAFSSRKIVEPAASKRKCRRAALNSERRENYGPPGAKARSIAIRHLLVRAIPISQLIPTLERSAGYLLPPSTEQQAWHDSDNKNCGTNPASKRRASSAWEYPGCSRA